MRPGTNHLRVILHADDLGMSERVNTAIFSLMDAGKVRSASILANGPAFEDAIARSRAFPRCSFGVHLNITQFSPLRPTAGLRPLLSEDGSFRRRQGSTLLSSSVRNAVLEEWGTQIQRVRDAGVEISHLDSHHHTHTLFTLLPCLQQLCLEQGIWRVRIRHTFTQGGFESSWRMDNRLYNRELRRRFTCANEFGPFAAFSATLPRFSSGDIIEVMLHPGNARYEAETRRFEETADREFLQQFQCISYGELN